jgi:hypothetical protein
MAFLKFCSLRVSSLCQGTFVVFALAVAVLVAAPSGANAAPLPVLTGTVDAGRDGLLQLVNCPPGYVSNYGRCVRAGYGGYRGYRGGPDCPPGTQGYQGRCVSAYGGRGGYYGGYRRYYRGGPDCPPGTRGYQGWCVPN